MFWAAIAMCSVAMGGCTIVQVHHASAIQTEFLAGVAQVSIMPSAKGLVVVSTQGVGVVLGARSTTIGWRRERLALIPEEGGCQMVFFENTAEQAAALLKLLADAGVGADQVCISTTEEGAGR